MSARCSSSTSSSVRYGSVAGRARAQPRGRPRRARRPDRAERRRQVDDAARDHGRRSRPPRATCGSPAGRSAAARRRRSRAPAIALVPEGRRIFGELTVEENLRLGLAARRDATASDAARRGVTSSSRCSPSSATRQAGALSGGQQQQLAIGARARRRPRRAPARRAVARALADPRRRRLRRARGDPRPRRHRSCSSSSARSARSRSPTAPTCSRTASCG